MTDKLDIYERDDRDSVMLAIEAFNDLMTFAEAQIITERYGLSLIFNPKRIDWTAIDPQKRYEGDANTPCGAVIMWDLRREDAEGRDETRPRLRLLK